MYNGARLAETAAMPSITGATEPELDPRWHEALTDLHAYVLALDAEWQRNNRAEVREESEALRATLAALRERLDPAGRYR
jgi:hypothetical protein